MSAFNWLTFQAICPVSSEPSTIDAQVHTYASYGGDETGRFHDRRYQLGDALAWWSASNPLYEEWKSPMTVTVDDGTTLECAYATCLSCGAEIWALTEFGDRRATRVVRLGTLDDWPAGFPK